MSFTNYSKKKCTKPPWPLESFEFWLSGTYRQGPGKRRKSSTFRAGFLNLRIIGNLGQIFLVARSFSVHCKLLNISSLSSLDASCILFLSCDNQKCLWMLPNACHKIIPHGKLLLQHVMLGLCRFAVLIHFSR